MSPYFPLREATEKVAIGTKTSYGNISAELIIEWMEAWKYIGVDKVPTYLSMALLWLHALAIFCDFTAVKLQFSDENRNCSCFIAHLSRRLIDELIVYPCSGSVPT